MLLRPVTVWYSKGPSSVVKRLLLPCNCWWFVPFGGRVGIIQRHKMIAMARDSLWPRNWVSMVSNCRPWIWLAKAVDTLQSQSCLKNCDCWGPPVPTYNRSQYKGLLPTFLRKEITPIPEQRMGVRITKIISSLNSLPLKVSGHPCYAVPLKLKICFEAFQSDPIWQHRALLC